MPKHTWFLIGRNSVNWKGNQKWSIADCQPCWIVCCSVAKLCPTLCNYMHCSIPGSSVLHCLLEFAQIHVLWVSDAVSSHPLLSPSPLPSVFPSIIVFSNELVLLQYIALKTSSEGRYSYMWRIDTRKISKWICLFPNHDLVSLTFFYSF